MQSDVPLDYAVFQLSPRRSRCELFVSYDGTTEKLASGLLKPFVTHLKVAEEQVALAVKSIKLEAERYQNAETWFTKGTLERFVRFVSTPEVLEMVNTFDAEMSQLEAARKIYSQGAGDNESGASGGDGTAASDATKKELLRAIDVRLSAVRQDLTTACSRASAAGFNPVTVLELQFFADRFGAHRLSEACSKFITLAQRRSDLFHNENSSSSTWKATSDSILRSSTSSDMSLDDTSDEQLRSSTCTTAKVTFPFRRLSREPSPSPAGEVDERESGKNKEIDKDKEVGSTTTTTESASTSTGKPQLTRRLSVQERINLFENKAQNSPSSATPVSSGGKPELRRLSSDVNTSCDKTVLRRWSGASDMSVDVSGERKEPDSNANTPTPTSASSFHPAFPPKWKEQNDLKSEEGNKDFKLPVGGFGSEEFPLSESHSKIASFSGRSSEKDQSGGGLVRSRGTSFGRGEDFGFEDQSTLIQTQFLSTPGIKEQFGSLDQSGTEKAKGPGGEGSVLEEGSSKSLETSFTGFKGVEPRMQGEAKDDELSGQLISKSNIRGTQRKTIEADSGSTVSEGFSSPANLKVGTEAAQLPPQPKWRSLGEVERAGRRDYESLEDETEVHLMQMENSGLVCGKFQGHGSGSDEMKKPRGTREGSGPIVGGSQVELSGKNIIENQETFPSGSSVPIDQVQRVRQTKGCQGGHDELKMKANELEKLFAEHKLRVPGDQSNAARRVRPVEMPKDVERSPVSRKQELEGSPAHLSTIKLEGEPTTGSTPTSKSMYSNDYDVTPKHNLYSLGFSDDSRGKLYQKYIQKRDAKLRQDWSSKRAEKEAKMRAMHDSLEKSRAEMKVKLSGSADKRSPAYETRCRSEKTRSFNTRSAMKRDQQPTDMFMSDEDQTEFLGKKLSETLVGDSSSRSAQSKRVLPNKNAASSTPRNSTAPVPRSSGKASNSAGGKRRLPYDNPLAQSVPNFSDLRKENTKPSSAGGKPVRPQGRNHARKKSISEDLPLVNEEKPRRSQSLRKSTATALELNDSRNSEDIDDTVFVPPKYDREEDEDFERFSKDVESKSLPRKGNGIGRMGGPGIPVASPMVEAVRNGHNIDDESFETEEITDIAREEEHDFGTTIGRESDLDNSKGRLSQESDKSENFGFENSNALRYVSQTGSTAELPSTMPSLFRSMGSTQDSPGESPGSWNSRLQNPFSFPNEISDIDALDSPLGSPASWNFHTLDHSETEAARMRKKWGAAQKPIVGIDSSRSPSRKDVTRGLKRFLKFGRKNRASESLADWISATTSEGDDSEDGRDLANRSSEDLRKSRMGFSQSHNSDEGFSGNDLFNEQVQALQTTIPTPANFKLREEHLSGSSLKAPKSFFSLSNFRSKANDSKPR